MKATTIPAKWRQGSHDLPGLWNDPAHTRSYIAAIIWDKNSPIYLDTPDGWNKDNEISKEGQGNQVPPRGDGSIYHAGIIRMTENATT
jgi:hypothetical protein